MMATEYSKKVADSIIEQLKTGTAPWIKPWEPDARFLPYNPLTGRKYHGINSLWLMSVAERMNYQDKRWMTYKQAQEKGGQVRKGEKGTAIEYWQWQYEEKLLDDNGNPLKNEEGHFLTRTVKYQRPRVFHAVVFNAAQMEGLPEAEARPILPPFERHERAESLLIAGGTQIEYNQGDRCYYNPAKDSIVLVDRAQFKSPDPFYAIALHEKAHWSGHQSRLARDILNPFGSQAYAKEELRAEIASLILCDELNIGHDPSNHVSYIGAWIEVLEKDPNEIFRAAADAEKIFKFLVDLEMKQTLTLGDLLSVENNTKSVVSIDLKEPEDTEKEAVYLFVPYSEKDKAKSLGAKWDKERRSWYVPEGMEKDKFAEWLTRDPVIVDSHIPPLEEFGIALSEAGLVLDSVPIMDGTIHRVRVKGDKAGAKSGSYVGFSDGHPAGYIKNYLTGFESSWKSKVRASGLLEQDKLRTQQEAEQKRKKRAVIQETKYEDSSVMAKSHWEECCY